MRIDVPAALLVAGLLARPGSAAGPTMPSGWRAADVVEHDYLYTNRVYRRPASTSLSGTVPDDALAVLWGVQPRFLNAALDLIDAEHGGMDRYLTERMRLDDAARARLAGLYLEAG